MATELEGLQKSYTALTELGNQLNELTVQIAKSSVDGGEVHLTQMKLDDVDVKSAGGLFAVTQEVSLNERAQTISAAAPKKGIELTKGAAVDYKRTQGG
ncbi:MAG: hypothetical protein WC632_02600 [Candidatus Margulisiibacteriota bacterium]